jgi:hypothetical protein
MKKSKLKNPTLLDDLAALAKLATTPEWKVFCRMAHNRIEYQKDKIIRLPESNPVKLAVSKAYERGLMAGLILIMKNVNNSAAEMEKLAEKEG